MVTTICYVLVYAGCVLMAYNIYRYVKFANSLRSKGGWETEGKILYIPTVLLVLFLVGYLMVGLFGDPDLVVAAILFGGSLFVLCMIVFLGIVSTRIQENERMGAKLRAAEESSRAKTSFLSTMSHEMRTPLNAIIGLNNMALKDQSLSDDTRDKLEKLDGSAHHLLTLINDVLDMNRIDSGQFELSSEPFMLQGLIDQTNIMIGGQCEEKGLEYHSEVIGDVDPCFKGDETKLKQVLVNILGNSVKFTNAPGSVSFIVEQSASYKDHRTLRFTMSDTGIGMDEDFLPNLFSAFTQEDTAMTSRYGGSGLGMAITKNIVEMMNGDIQVKSTKGVGSTFIVTVSLQACDPDSEGQQGDAVSCGASNETGEEGVAVVPLEGLHVLMAEDVELNAEILMDLLDLEGITADHAENGQVAVEMFEQAQPGRYDAVLMDVRMPIMDGLCATSAIRALDHPDAKTVPVIAMTANAFAEDEQRSLQAGMDAHLSKPIEPDLLYETLGKLVAERRRGA